MHRHWEPDTVQELTMPRAVANSGLLRLWEKSAKKEVVAYPEIVEVH